MGVGRRRITQPLDPDGKFGGLFGGGGGGGFGGSFGGGSEDGEVIPGGVGANGLRDGPVITGHSREQHLSRLLEWERERAQERERERQRERDRDRDRDEARQREMERMANREREIEKRVRDEEHERRQGFERRLADEISSLRDDFSNRQKVLLQQVESAIARIRARAPAAPAMPSSWEQQRLAALGAAAKPDALNSFFGGGRGPNPMGGFPNAAGFGQQPGGGATGYNAQLAAEFGSIASSLPPPSDEEKYLDRALRAVDGARGAPPPLIGGGSGGSGGMSPNAMARQRAAIDEAAGLREQARGESSSQRQEILSQLSRVESDVRLPPHAHAITTMPCNHWSMKSTAEIGRLLRGLRPSMRSNLLSSNRDQLLTLITS